MIEQAGRNAVTFEAVTGAKFEMLKNEKGLVPYRIYFVGHSKVASGGFGGAETGEIHVAVTSDSSVRFIGTGGGDIDKALSNLKKEIMSKVEDDVYYRNIYEKTEISHLSENITEKVAEYVKETAKSINEYATYNDFPDTGESGNLYISEDTGAVYRWNGDSYVVIGGYKGGFGVDIDGVQIYTTAISEGEINRICI